MPWWLWVTIGYCVVVVLLIKPTFIATLRENNVKTWSDFYGYLVLSIVLSIFFNLGWGLWLPFVGTHWVIKRALGNNAREAVRKLTS